MRKDRIMNILDNSDNPKEDLIKFFTENPNERKKMIKDIKKSLKEQIKREKQLGFKIDSDKEKRALEILESI